MLTTVALAVAFRFASTFPQTYGPLAGVVALLLWTYLSALAIFYGVAVAAELEATAANARPLKAIPDHAGVTAIPLHTARTT